MDTLVGATGIYSHVFGKCPSIRFYAHLITMSTTPKQRRVAVLGMVAMWSVELVFSFVYEPALQYLQYVALATQGGSKTKH